MSVQLRRGISSRLVGSSRIVFKQCSGKVRSCLGWRLTAHSCLHVVLQLCHRGLDGLAVSFSDSLIISNQCCEGDTLRRRESGVETGAVIAVLYPLAVLVFVLFDVDV